MPWDNQTAPGAMIEVTDACNVTCASCYKRSGDRLKSLTEIERDIDAACSLRPLHTLSISGGEPTLHPELCGIIRCIKQRGLLAFLLTNGVLIDEMLIRRLKEAGLDAILFHVDTGQQRPDVAGTDGLAAVEARLSHLAQLAATVGIDVSASMTLLDDAAEQLPEIIRFFLSNHDLTFLFLARGITPEQLFRDRRPADEEVLNSDFTLRTFMKILDERHALVPFSYIPDRAGIGTNWITYFVPILHDRDDFCTFRIQSNVADLALLRLHRLMAGRYMQKSKQNAPVTLLRAIVNGLATCRPLQTARFATAVLKRGVRLRHKMIVYDHGPTWNADGELSYCEYCATAIVRSGKLLPCCLADYQPGGSTKCW
jgi:pyruvate-formate lyase-activating enzyme